MAIHNFYYHVFFDLYNRIDIKISSAMVFRSSAKLAIGEIEGCILDRMDKPRDTPLKILKVDIIDKERFDAFGGNQYTFLPASPESK